MKKREIEFRIGADGDIEIEVIDGEGKECLETTKSFEAVLGKVSSRDYKPDYYRDALVEDEEHIKQMES